MPVREFDALDIYLAGGAIMRKMREFQGAPENRCFDKLTPEQQAQVREAGYKAILPKKAGKR